MPAPATPVPQPPVATPAVSTPPGPARVTGRPVAEGGTRLEPNTSAGSKRAYDGPRLVSAAAAEPVAAEAPAFSSPPRPIWQETPPPPVWAPAEAAPAVPSPRPILTLAIQYSAMAMLALVAIVAALIVLYRWVDPPTSMLMLGQRLSGTTITQHWRALEHISPNLQLAVIVAEDGRFCRHHGVDWEELESAIDQSTDGVARGGSTIAMQTVKNLFLWPAKSYVRKAIEIPLAYGVDAVWSKRRLLEIYLNIAEWGPGVFGAEAAARYHFRKPASLLNAREAALLAVSLPNPFDRRAGAPGPGTQRLAANLMLRMRAGPSMARCLGRAAGF